MNPLLAEDRRLKSQGNLPDGAAFDRLERDVVAPAPRRAVVLPQGVTPADVERWAIDLGLTTTAAAAARRQCETFGDLDAPGLIGRSLDVNA